MGGTTRFAAASLALVMAAGLAACSGTAGSSSWVRDRVPQDSPAAADARGTPSPSTPAPSVAASSPSPTASPSETADPVESAGYVSPEDLLIGLPSDKQMSAVQGWRWVPERSASKGYRLDPRWATAPPLSRAETKESGFGSIRRVLPQECDGVAAMVNSQMAEDFGNADYAGAVAYTARRVNVTYADLYRPNWTLVWMTTIAEMPTGEALRWTENALNMASGCRVFSSVPLKGRVIKTKLNKTLKAYRSGQAAVLADRISSDVWIYYVAEAVGDLYVRNVFGFMNPTSAVLSRASKVINTRSDALAELEGVTRDPVGLARMSRVKGAPTEYAAPALVGSEAVPTPTVTSGVSG